MKEIENELLEEAIKEELEMEDVNLSFLVDTRDVPMNVLSDIVETPISQVDFGIIQEIE